MRKVQLAGMVVLALVLTGCSEPALQTTTCMLYEDLSDPSAKADVADLVIVGENLGTDGVSPLYGVNATAHTIRVDEVMKGELEPAEIRVLSSPDACAADDVYPEGDPLAETGATQFFLTRIDGQWTSVSPFVGAEPLGPNGELHWDPAAPSPTPTP